MAQPPQGQSCSNCMYWMTPGGECHKNPPYVVLSQLSALANTVSKWPGCAATDWCGSYTLKP
jgi:hypothetical protein